MSRSSTAATSTSSSRCSTRSPPAALSPANIAAPLRSILRTQRNTRVLLGEVAGFDLAAKTVQLKDGGAVPFDSLIVATGSTHHYFGNDEWAEFAPGLKTIEDATEIRRRVLSAFEQAERDDRPGRTARGCSRSSSSAAGRPASRWPARSANWPCTRCGYDFRSIDPADCPGHHRRGAEPRARRVPREAEPEGEGGARGDGHRGADSTATSPTSSRSREVKPDSGKGEPYRIETDDGGLGGGGEGEPAGQADRGRRRRGGDRPRRRGCR